MIRKHAADAKDFTKCRHRHRGVIDEREKGRNRDKSEVRAKVEHSVNVIKRVFGFTNVRYRGLAKNANRPFINCAFTILFIARHRLKRAITTGGDCPQLGHILQQSTNKPQTRRTQTDVRWSFQQIGQRETSRQF